MPALRRPTGRGRRPRTTTTATVAARSPGACGPFSSATAGSPVVLARLRFRKLQAARAGSPDGDRGGGPALAAGSRGLGRPARGGRPARSPVRTSSWSSRRVRARGGYGAGARRAVTTLASLRRLGRWRGCWPRPSRAIAGAGGPSSRPAAPPGGGLRRPGEARPRRDRGRRSRARRHPVGCRAGGGAGPPGAGGGGRARAGGSPPPEPAPGGGRVRASAWSRTARRASGTLALPRADAASAAVPRRAARSGPGTGRTCCSSSTCSTSSWRPRRRRWRSTGRARWWSSISTSPCWRTAARPTA
jgi:hypothetical protein